MHFKFLQFHETSPQSLQMFQQLTSPHQTFSDKIYLYFAPRDIREHTDADFTDQGGVQRWRLREGITVVQLSLNVYLP
jgi:hypothetical protein